MGVAGGMSVSQTHLVTLSKTEMITFVTFVVCKCFLFGLVQNFVVWELVNSLPNDKILDVTKLKTFADDKINAAQMMISTFDRVKKHCGKRRKCWLLAFSSFPIMFSKGFFLGSLKVGIVW